LQDSGFLEAGVKMVSLFSGVWKAAKKLNMFGTELKCLYIRVVKVPVLQFQVDIKRNVPVFL